MALICAPNPLILKSNKPQVARFGAQIRHVPTCISYPCHRSLQNKLPTERIRRNRIVCEIALEETVASVEDLKLKAKVGDRVLVRGPLKVYHIPKTPEFDIGGMEGEVKDYVGVWKALEDHQKNQEYMVPISVDPKKTTTTIVDALQARDDGQQNSQKSMQPFSIDLNQMTTIMDTMQSGNGVDDIHMEDHDQHFFG